MVKGDYLFVVTTHGFNNSGSLLSNGACCDHDEGGSCAVPGCDSFFRYCLRRSRNGLDEHCRTSQTNFDDGHLDFSESTFLSLPNPLPLQGLTRNWNV